MRSYHESVRLFVSVPLSKDIADLLASWMQENRKFFAFRKWVHPQDYHITLQFLGETTTKQIDGLQTVLSSIHEQPLSLKLNGAGFFGTPQAPRILWAGVSGNLTGLNNLHATVIESTQQCGFVAEKRPFAAHITLARNYIGEHEFNKEAIQSAPVGVGWEANRFTLMRTHMHVSPMYEIIESYPLN